MRILCVAFYDVTKLKIKLRDEQQDTSLNVAIIGSSQFLLALLEPPLDRGLAVKTREARNVGSERGGVAASNDVTEKRE